MRSSARLRASVVLVALVATPVLDATSTPKASYTEALTREERLRRELGAAQGRADGSISLLRRIRVLVAEYEALARRYPRSGYSDNALFQAALISGDAYRQFGDETDRQTALRLFADLAARFPTSSLNRQVPVHAQRLGATMGSAPTVSAVRKTDQRALLKAIRRDVLPDAVRVTLELEREATFHDERIDGPPRVFIDLQDTRTTEELKDVSVGFADDVVRQIRVGRHIGATRVVLDLEGAARHSVYALYDPYRIVIDFERSASVAPAPAREVQVAPTREAAAAATREAGFAPRRAAQIAPTGAAQVAPTGAASVAPTPVPASANRAGGFSIARQLGLGISRVVLDPGHGGYDPGARVKGLNEADITLDVAQRLEKLLLKKPGVEVLLTRRANVYVALEERTAIANQSAADLFLSIHVNASTNARAHGIETYFLNFAPNPEAEAIAARENAGSSKTMHHLPDIVRAIALNNKIDESRDFAAIVQSAMFDRLKKSNRQARNLGVKQAPFMVLIGATMPSVLTEISFLTNRQEARLLRTSQYRQAIAEALLAGISKYQTSLKAAQTVASQ
jgi:N-acetylmuramoyl-L-alanine amidase